MNREYEQNRTSSLNAATAASTYNYTVEPGQLSRSTLLRKPEHAIASGLVQRKARDGTSPGTPTLTDRMPDHDVPSIHQIADRGMSGTAGTLPFLEIIQRSFGPDHDLSGVRGYVGGPATAAAAEIGALAYARGEQVAFAESPSLHTAAHEAAHVVQQRAGVHLKGGVGVAGDSYERNADEVADRVVQGLPVHDLLPACSGCRTEEQRLTTQLNHNNLGILCNTSHYRSNDGQRSLSENINYSQRRAALNTAIQFQNMPPSQTGSNIILPDANNKSIVETLIEIEKSGSILMNVPDALKAAGKTLFKVKSLTRSIKR